MPTANCSAFLAAAVRKGRDGPPRCLDIPTHEKQIFLADLEVIMVVQVVVPCLVVLLEIIMHDC